MMQIIMSLVISIVGYAVCYRNFHHPWPTGMHVCASLFYFIWHGAAIIVKFPSWRLYETQFWVLDP